MTHLTQRDGQPVPLPTVAKVYQARTGATVAILKSGEWCYVTQNLTEASRLLFNDRAARTVDRFMSLDDTDLLGPDGDPWPIEDHRGRVHTLGAST